MSEFEHSSGGRDAIANFGFSQTPEQIAAQNAENAERSERAARLLAEEKARQDKEQAIEDARLVLRNEEITAREVIAAIMEANPNFDHLDAKKLYRDKIREVVAVRRFEELFFRKPDTAKKMFSEIKM